MVFAKKWEIGYLCEKCGKELEKYKLNLVENEEVLINENLYIKGEISRELYEQAKIKIVERRKG